MAIELNHASVKILYVIGLTLGLMIPLSQVESQIGSRRDHEEEAEREVAKGWGQFVELHAPTLLTPVGWIEARSADTGITVDTREKKKGVFRFPVFLTTVKSKVKFEVPARHLDPNGHKPFVDRVVFGVKPIASIQRISITDSKGKQLKGKLVGEGIEVDLGDRREGYNEELSFEVLARGTGPITYASSADQDNVRMSGNWTKPRYLEDLLPDQSKLGPQGFDASWQLFALPNGGDGPRQVHQLGLSHLWIGTDYAMIERATKYGVLFIALTFLLVLIVEFVGKVCVHPLQYGLIGAAISVFYLLLLAIAEITGFDWAYVISSAAVTALIVTYSKGFVKSARYIRFILLEQAVLSGFFYILLSLQERSFLVGSVGLFVALAAFMLGTRKVDWYAATVGRS